MANATNNAGISVSGLTTDFDGEVRSATTPDIGADEYSPINIDMKVESWVLPVDTVSINGGNTIQIKVTNTGALARTNVPVKYSINNGQTFVTETISGTIQPDSSVVYTFTTLANFPSFGNKHCLALTNDAGDLNPSNDTVFTNVFASSPLNGVYTLGHTASNDFISLAQFSIVLEHCGVSGPVTLNVDSGGYDGKVVFKNTSGASLSNTITIKGLGEQTVFTNSVAFEYSREVFEFDNAKFFVLDSLYIAKYFYSVYFTGIRFHDEADSNTVKNCIISVDNAYYGFGIISSASSHSTTSGGDNGDGLHIDNNTIIGGVRGIQLSGNNYADFCSDNHVTNNTVIGAGIHFHYQDGGEISGNTIIGGSSGISSTHGKNGLAITNNKIDIASGVAIYIDHHNYYSTNGSHGLIINNSISNASQAGGSSATGIYISSCLNVDVFYNSVNIIGTSEYSMSLRLEYVANLGISINNNIFSNRSGGWVVYSSSLSTGFTSNYNNLYASGSKFSHQGSADQTTFTAWKTASGGDTNSVSLNPYFFTEQDLRTIAVNDFGIPINSLTLDILDVTRSAATPDIGAYEYSIPTGVDLGPDTTICNGIGLILTAAVATEYLGFDYFWVNAITGDTLTGSLKTLSIDSVGTYAAHVSHPSGYILSDTIVLAQPGSTSFTGLNANYCLSDSSSILVGTPTSGLFSGNGIVGSTFNPTVAGLGFHQVSYTYTDSATTCVYTSNNSTNVSLEPIAVMSNDTVICVGDTIAIHAAVNPVSGITYLWSTGETTIGLNVSPSVLTSYVVTIDNGNCQVTDTVVVNVNAIPVLAFTGLDSTYCENDALATLVGTPTGGLFSGFGISGTSFNPIIPGTSFVSYFYTDPITTCTNLIMDSTLVHAAPNNMIIGLDTSYCFGDALVNLNFYPAADSVSGTGIIQPNVFNPTLANIGTHNIIFIYTDANSCSNSDTTAVTIHALPTVTLSGLNNSYCLDNANDTLVGIPTGGYYMGPGAYPEIFEPAIVGLGAHDIIYVYTDGFGCVNYDTNSTIVYGLPTVTLMGDTSICDDYSMVIDASTFSSYVWNTGDTTQTITVDASTAGIGTFIYSVIITDQNMCIAADSVSITIEASPISQLSDSVSICGQDQSILLTAGTNTSNNYLWSDGSLTGSLFIDSANLGNSMGYMFVTIDSPIGCTVYDSVFVHFKEIPNPNIGADTTICWNKTIVLDAGSGYKTYTWSTGESTQTINLDSLAFNLGANSYSAEVLNFDNCSNSDTINLVVDICTGILSPELKLENIYVFPNPSTGNVEIQLTGLQNKHYQLEVYNAIGALTFEKNFDNNGNDTQTWTVDLTSKAKGVYFIQLQSEGQLKIERLIIQ